MELKESVIMDITEAFRSEDIGKTDFFDFVVTSDANDPHPINQFGKQMRTVNAFLGSTGLIGEKETNNNSMTLSNNNNNNNTTNNNNINSSNNNTDGGILLGSDLGTHISSSTTPSSIVNNSPTSNNNNNSFDTNFWSDKETVRLETAILDDLNKYCWSADDTAGLTVPNSKIGGGISNSGSNNDGQIYTLTVLNGLDQNAAWYRQPLTAIIKEEESSITSPNSMEQLQAGLDIESILSIMPGQMNGFSHNFNEANTDGLIKSETYTYEDSGFADNKDELASSLIIDTPLLEAHDNFNSSTNNTNNSNNNNNDWKMANNNNHDSLLRSALQGKAFVRYNGTNGTKPTAVKSESNVELRRALSTPPSKSDPIFIKDENNHIPTIVAGIDANGKVIFEEQRSSVSQARSEDNNNNNSATTTSTTTSSGTGDHNVDDLLLSQLDQSFPEDFEKLKRIANEVVESVNQYCHIEQSGDGTTAVYSIAADQIGILSSLGSPALQLGTPSATVTVSSPVTTTPVVSSTKSPSNAKKYKRSNSNSNVTKTHTTQVQSATSTSNGIRKERSLHYCSICSKGFKDKYSVNVHIRTHTGEKPFACSLCGKSFRQKAHLAKHYQTHIAQKNAAAAGNAVVSKTKSR